MNQKRSFLVPALVAAVLATLVCAPAAQAATYTVDKAHSEVSFSIRHLMANVRGHFGDFSATIEMDPTDASKSSVDFTIQAASIDTNNENRDKHLRSADFFDVEKFPQITFKSTSVKATGKDSYEVTGHLALRGVTKVITLPVSYLGELKDPWGNVKAGFSTATTLNRQEFGVSWNKALDAGGFLLDDVVKVEINFEVARK